MDLAHKKYSWALKTFASLTIIERLFRILHWPYANYLALIAAVVLVIFYPLRYIDKSNKEILDHVKVALALMIGINTLLHLEHVLLFQGAILVLFSYWFLNEGLFYLNIRLDFWNQAERDGKILDDLEKDPPQYNYTIDLLFATGILALMAGATFKVMHWPGASVLLIVGASVVALMIWFKKI